MTTPALSWKTDTHQSLSSSWVAAAMVVLRQVVDDLAVHLDQAAEGLVLAVLAPGLGDGL